jgi:hypothetical protein
MYGRAGAAGRTCARAAGFGFVDVESAESTRNNGTPLCEEVDSRVVQAFEMQVSGREHGYKTTTEPNIGSVILIRLCFISGHK